MERLYHSVAKPDCVTFRDKFSRQRPFDRLDKGHEKPAPHTFGR